MLEGIIGLASKLSLEVVADGIEESEQLDLVRTMGCQMGQGFLLARPAPPHQLEALLASGVGSTGAPTGEASASIR
jgi:EAL domain-containing protein (putative c-di-GMP-specific phosphodiesterase class I)